MKKITLFICAWALLSSSFGQIASVILEKHGDLLSVTNVKLLPDPGGQLQIESVTRPDINGSFYPATETNILLSDSVNVYWLQFDISNKDSKPGHVVVSFPTWTKVNLFVKDSLNETFTEKITGTILPLSQRDYPIADNCYIDHLLKEQETITCWVRLETNRIAEIPIKDLSFQVSSKEYVDKQDNQIKSIIYLFMGVYLSMFLYNLFLYFSTKEKTYIYYLGMIVFFMYFPLRSSGYLYSVFSFYENLPENVLVFDAISTTCVALFTILFVVRFLSLKVSMPKYYKILTYAVVGICFIPFTLFISYDLWLGLWNLAVLSYTVLLLIIIIKSYRRKFPSSGFLLFAFMFSIAGIVVGVLGGLELLPLTNFTYIYAVPLGSSLEMVLLSFALGNKINLLRNENEDKQKEIINQLRENKRIQDEAEQKLEEKVRKRTHQLNQVNQALSTKKEELEESLRSLKEAEAQLIESEKMSTLGQLAAGIAHEVNNSVNIIASSIDPLRMDLVEIEEFISDYRAENKDEVSKHEELTFLFQEVNGLMKGIEDGAMKTKDIVSSLRMFSRVDEEDLKFVKINDGIESTLALIKYKLTDRIQLVKNYGDLDLVECVPGKINQVFMNLLINAIQAIESEGQITIKTWQDDDNVYVSVKDTGVGIPEKAISHIYEPFFTTKDVGKGTGLGLSVTYGIIEQHRGTISVQSEEGTGTEFTISLPIKSSPDLD